MAKITKSSENQDKVTSVFAREGNGNIQITFTIPYPLIKKAQEETIEEMAKDIEIPGFRKGNAPLAKVAEKIPQATLIEHSLGHILPVALGQAIEEHKLKIAIYPKYELIKANQGENWEVKAVTCELPEVNLGDYKKLIAGEVRAASLKKELTKDEKEQTVIRALTQIKIDIPQILIEEEATSRLSTLLSRLEKLGVALESYLSSTGKKVEDLRAEYAAGAKEAISLDLILNKVAEAEGLKVEPKEVEQALAVSQATAPHEDIEGKKRLLESILKRRHALDFLMSLS